MRLLAFKQIVGLSPLPTDVLDLVRLVNFADSNHVLGQMAARIAPVETTDRVSGRVTGNLRDIFANATLRSEHDHTMLTFEMNRVERALEGSGISPIVLKGGAYVARSMTAARGRRVSDLDILVRPEELDAAEKALLKAGWEADTETDNPYDQQYYRQHMHELPPLRHKKRGTVLDVHHALLPGTSRFFVDTQKMLASARPLAGSNLRTFDQVDLFIHSSVHAFADGALDAPVRTLVELFLIFDEMPAELHKTIADRAEAVGAPAPVGIALWAIGRLFGREDARLFSSRLVKPYRFLLLKAAVLSKAKDGAGAPVGKALLYLRSHYLRMPLYLLIPHLARKVLAWRPGRQTPVELPFP